MKKIYVIPAVEIEHVSACQMMALSIFDEDAVKDSEVLVVEENDYLDIWED